MQRDVRLPFEDLFLDAKSTKYFNRLLEKKLKISFLLSNQQRTPTQPFATSLSISLPTLITIYASKANILL